MTFDRKDLASGLFFIAVSLVYGGISLQSLPIGRALNMGPGYFPVILSGILLVLGVAIAIRSFVFASADSPFGTVPWRAVVMISLAIIVFAALLSRLGMLPAIFVTALLASLASPQIRLRSAVFFSLGIAAFCTAVFGYGVKLPIPVFGSWFAI